MVPLWCDFWQRINGIAQVRSAKLAEVDLDYVLGVGGFDLERFVHGYDIPCFGKALSSTGFCKSVVPLFEGF